MSKIPRMLRTVKITLIDERSSFSKNFQEILEAKMPKPYLIDKRLNNRQV